MHIPIEVVDMSMMGQRELTDIWPGPVLVSPMSRSTLRVYSGG